VRSGLGVAVPGHVASDFGHEVLETVVIQTSTREQEAKVLDFIIRYEGLNLATTCSLVGIALRLFGMLYERGN
jgi:hypothetical protein